MGDNLGIARDRKMPRNTVAVDLRHLPRKLHIYWALTKRHSGLTLAIVGPVPHLNHVPSAGPLCGPDNLARQHTKSTSLAHSAGGSGDIRPASLHT